MEDGNQRNARQAEGEEGSEQWRDEWRAAGVVAGQASCQGAPLNPCTERSRHMKRKRGESRGEVQRSGRGSEPGSRDSRRQDGKECESRKREGVRKKVSKSPCRCRREFDFPAHLPACQLNC